MFRYFAKGRRGIVYKGKYKGKDVILKVESRDLRRINNEILWLKRLNKFKIGPKMIFSGDGWFIYEFVKGIPLNEWVVGKRKVKKVLLGILEKCRVMDKLRVNKEEMHRPFKNVLVYKGKAKLIDFERCNIRLKPKNVTQFCQFIILVLKLDRRKVLPHLRKYHKNQNDKNFKELVKVLF